MLSTKFLAKEDILSLAKKVFNREIKSNPNNFTFDPDHCNSRKLKIETSNIYGTISHHERCDDDYTIRLHVRNIGYTVVISDYYNGKVIFFFDNGDYGRIKDYNEDDMLKCFNIIYNELLNY